MTPSAAATTIGVCPSLQNGHHLVKAEPQAEAKRRQWWLDYFRHTTLPGGGDIFDKTVARLLVKAEPQAEAKRRQWWLDYFRHTTLPGGGDIFDKTVARLLVARCYMLCNSHEASAY